MKSFATLVGAAVLMSGCASIIRGTKEDVVIDVEPSHAKVETSIGMSCQGDCVIKVPRKQSFTVTASAPGYRSQTVPVGTRMSGGGGGALAGNILLGGIIGGGVDVATGATLDHYPNPVTIRLNRQ